MTEELLFASDQPAGANLWICGRGKGNLFQALSSWRRTKEQTQG